MKKPILELASASTKIIKINEENIATQIHRMACDFETKWGRQLEAFLVGPNEYGALVKLCSQSSAYGQKGYALNQIEEFMGMKVRVKASRGFEPEFPKEMWGRIAMGLIVEGVK